MLPADLPEELQNVAVDADRGGDGYGVLSLYRPTGNVVEGYVHANDVGTLVAAPDPPTRPQISSRPRRRRRWSCPTARRQTSGTWSRRRACLVNQGPFWEGSFEREGHHYVLRVLLDDPSGDIARRALSSMVEVPDSAASGPRT
jgi:hypothetical protein